MDSSNNCKLNKQKPLLADIETKTRQLSGKMSIVVSVIAVCFSLFQI